jgi:DNA-binding Lrp family transcriptional regulator
MDRSEKNASSLLSRLRQQSDAVRAAETPRRSTEDILQDIDQRLWRLYRFLDEVLAHLAVIKPVVAHQFRIDQLLSLSGLHFEQGFVSYRRRHLAGQELLDYVEAFYRLAGSQPLKFRVPPGSVGNLENRLRNAGIPFRYEAELDERKVIKAGSFLITPAVTASVRFSPDYRSQEIGVRLTNVDRFESVNLEFKPEQFVEEAFEDLVRMMLGESNAFLRRAPLAGVGAARKAPVIDEQVVYRVEKTLRSR